MTGWLRLTEAQRKTSIDQAAFISGIQAKAIEKDWWVTLTLQALFQSTASKYLVFKGGTSLSKCWKLIQRFSEDIDIALSAGAFGMEYKETPNNEYLKKLKRQGCEYTTTHLKTALENEFKAMGIPSGFIIVEAAEIKEAMPDTDPQILFVKFVSMYDKNAYLEDKVKIEVSARSLNEPHSIMPVLSMLHEIYPNPAYAEIPFEVTVMEPQKTFLEKAFLLHEEFMKPFAGKAIRTERMSRHLYDIEKMMDTEFENKALANELFYTTIITHRQNYSRYNWLDYGTLAKALINFLPPAGVADEYRKDYGEMQEHMIYGKSLKYDELMARLQVLLDRFKKAQ